MTHMAAKKPQQGIASLKQNNQLLRPIQIELETNEVGGP
jgi:hypothetical protein